MSEHEECKVPPVGWRCTRGAGHGGPCAAVESRPAGKYEELIALARTLDRDHIYAKDFGVLALVKQLTDALESAGALDLERLETIGRLQEKYVKDTDILFLARKAAERALESLPNPPAGEPEREALDYDGIIAEARNHVEHFAITGGDAMRVTRLADALEAARREPEPREVTTAAERDALPIGTVILSAAGTISARFDRTIGTVFGDERAYPWSNLALPARVLFIPSEVQR